jgi:hypothetical protein
MKLSICAVIGLTSIATLSFADAINDQSNKEQFYIIGAMGSSANTDYDIYNANGSPAIGNDINYTSYRLGFGLLHSVTQQTSVGLEAAYNFYGDETYTYFNLESLEELDSAEVKFSAFDILGVLAIKLNQTWTAKAKLGVAYEDIAATEEGFNANMSEKGWVPEIAAGIAYRFTDNVELEGSFAYLVGQVTNIDDMPDITVGWLGVNYYI